MKMLKLGTLVTAKRLAECLVKSPKNVTVLDATWFLPNSKVTGYENFQHGHIPGSVFFDIDACVTESQYEHMLPTQSIFADYVGKLGIDNETHVVVYNDHPNFAIFSAPRVWFTFRAFGHHSVSVLDGGLRAWQDAGFEITKDIVVPERKTFIAKYNPNLLKSFEDVEQNIDSQSFQLLDARSAGRFNGTDPEPRSDTKPGHIPGGVSAPFNSFLCPYTTKQGEDISHGNIKQVDDIKKTFKQMGVDLTKPITATCGTGISACNIALAAYLCGKHDVSIYDGSWLEWYKRSTPSQRVNCPED